MLAAGSRCGAGRSPGLPKLRELKMPEETPPLRVEKACGTPIRSRISDRSTTAPDVEVTVFTESRSASGPHAHHHQCLVVGPLEHAGKLAQLPEDVLDDPLGRGLGVFLQEAQQGRAE